MNIKQILHFSLGPIGSAALGLITLPIVTWFFSTEDIGRLTMLQVSISFTLLLFTLGLDQAFVREYHEVGDKSPLLKATILPGFVVLVAVLILLFVLPWSVSLFLFGSDSEIMTILFYASLLLVFISRFLSLILRMEERGFAFSVSQVLPKLIFLILIGLYILTSVNAVFENLLLAQVISYLSVFLILLWNTSTQWIPALKATIDKSQLFKMIRFGFPLIGGGLAFWGLTAMDRFFLRSLSSFSELGIYSVSVSFAGAALVFQAVFSTVWVPIVYKWASNDIEVNKVEEVINFVVVVVILIWSIAGMLSWIVPYLLPPEYNAVQNILLSAMAYPLLYTLSEATGVGIGIKRKTVYAMTAAIVALVLNGIGNFLFIPIYGAAGAAISSGFSFLVFLIVKTEISAKIWFDFSRYKIYLFMTVAVIFSAFMCLVEANKIIYPSLWFMFLLVSFVFFRKSYCSILMRIRNLR